MNLLNSNKCTSIIEIVEHLFFWIRSIWITYSFLYLIHNNNLYYINKNRCYKWKDRKERKQNSYSNILSTCQLLGDEMLKWTRNKCCPIFITFWEAAMNQLNSSKRMLACDWCNGAPIFLQFGLLELSCVSYILL